MLYAALYKQNHEIWANTKQCGTYTSPNARCKTFFFTWNMLLELLNLRF